MAKLAGIVLSVLLLSVTGFLINYADAQTQIASPAATFCVENGGTLETVKSIQGGERGKCTLPDGTVCGDWEYFRGECPPPSEEFIFLKAEVNPDLVVGQFCAGEEIQLPDGEIVHGDIAMIGRMFTINYEDEAFDIMVFNCGNEVESLTFNQFNRYIMIEGVGSELVAEVLLPSRLVGGDFTVFADDGGNLEFELFTPEEYSIDSGFDLSKENEEYLRVRGLELLMSEEPINVIRIYAPTSTIAIQGTTAIPEFPLGLLSVVILGFLSMIICSRKMLYTR